MAKKIFALVAAVVLVVCFSVTSFAATVLPTTTYVAGGKADVTVKVTGVDEGTNVTYYATNGTAPVFVDQKKADSNGATFNFVTDIKNVESEVVVGYTGGAKDEGVIPDAAKYAIKYAGETLDQVYPGEGTTVTIANPAGAFETVTSVTATNATVVYDADETEIKVTLSNVTGEAVISVETDVIAIPDYVGTLDIVEAAAVVVAANADYEAGIKIDAVKADLEKDTPDSTDANEIASANANAEGDRKLTVCGKVLGEYTEYGIIVSETAIATENLRPAAFEAAYADKKYEAGTVAPDGRFAVQLIDISTAEEGTPFVVAGTPYYTAVYAYSEANQAYYVEAYSSTVAAN